MHSDLDYLSSKFSCLNLDFILNKLSSEYYELPRWPENLAAQIIEFYRRFLWLNYIYPEAKLVPTRDIDECWHIHILNTKRYVEDCQALFGRYFHHQPADPSDPLELIFLQEKFEETRRLYRENFGEELKVFHSR